MKIMWSVYMKKVPLCAAVAVLCFAAQLAWAAPPDLVLAEEDHGRLAEGKIIVKTYEPSGTKAGYVSAAVLIPAQASIVWRVMTDYDHGPEFIPACLATGCCSARQTMTLSSRPWIYSRFCPK